MSEIPWSVVMDAERLRELKELRILDTLPEQCYDDLAAIARTICDTPVANITFVAEDRQWFKSRIGSAVAETPIEQSVCAHTIGETRELIINDLTEDHRTRHNVSMAGETSLRFYAGVPLRLEARFGIGTLCVLDTKPHPAGLSAAQADALRALGRQVTILLQVRKMLARRTSHDFSGCAAPDPLEDIAEHLISAYNISKHFGDKLLETLLATGLSHVGTKIAKRQYFQ